MTTTTPELTDIGPSPTAPDWCLPGTAPNTDSTGEGGYLWSWTREISGAVWIEAEDRVVDGRVMRSEPRIVYPDTLAAGVTCEQALELARCLVAAADVIACTALDGSQS